MMRWVASVTVGLLVASLLAACSPAVPDAAPPNDAATHRQFGAPAVPAPAGFTYQPDVRIVGGGKNAVISGSADGTTWTLDANAPGMSGVKVGDVLWATSYVAGRVLTLTRTPSTAIVMLLPVPITDFIRDGRLKANTVVSSANMTSQYRAPDDATVVSSLPSPSTPALGGAAVIAPAALMDRSNTAESGSGWAGAKPGYNQGSDVSLRGFEVSSTYAPDGLNLSVTKKENGVKLGVDFGLHWESLRFKSDTSISGGDVTSSSTSLSGLKSVTATLTGGAASPGLGIPRLRIEVPWTQQVQIDELPPVVMQIKVAFILGATFGGKDATISAHGEWRLDGSAGTEDGKPEKPSFGILQSLIDSISGISLGDTGLVFAVSVRALIGLGVPGVAIGPYAKITVAIGIANGSALGAPLVRCHSATLDINVAAGVGFDITSELPSVLVKAGQKYIDKIKGSLSSFAELNQPVVARTQTLPDVPLCTAG